MNENAFFILSLNRSYYFGLLACPTVNSIGSRVTALCARFTCAADLEAWDGLEKSARDAQVENGAVDAIGYLDISQASIATLMLLQTGSKLKCETYPVAPGELVKFSIFEFSQPEASPAIPAPPVLDSEGAV